MPCNLNHHFFVIPFHLILILIIIASSSLYLQPVTASPKHDNFIDLKALLNFRDHTNPCGILATNWTANTSFCSWVGVRCADKALELKKARQDITGKVIFMKRDPSWRRERSYSPMAVTRYRRLLQRARTQLQKEGVGKPISGQDAARIGMVSKV